MSAQKTVIAKYSTFSRFEIPSEVSAYEIRWNTLTYTGKDGNEVEVKPTMSAEEDTEMLHRPKDAWIDNEPEIDEEEPPSAFWNWARDVDHDILIEMLWNRMSCTERRETLQEQLQESFSDLFDASDSQIVKKAYLILESSDPLPVKRKALLALEVEAFSLKK